MVLESKIHNIKKEEREREKERNIDWDYCYEENKTCGLCSVEFVSSCVNLNHISNFFEGWCHLVDLNHISNAFVKQIIKNKKIGVYRFILFIFYFLFLLKNCC